MPVSPPEWKRARNAHFGIHRRRRPELRRLRDLHDTRSQRRRRPGTGREARRAGDGGRPRIPERSGWQPLELADVAYRSGARIHSDSWGAACYDALGNCIPGCTMPYDSFARDADLAMWTYPDLLLVLAAGNAWEFCPPPLAVGTPATAQSPLASASVGYGAAAGTPS